MSWQRYSEQPRQYVADRLPVEQQDRGANDEGYYYAWCPCCEGETEQDDGVCFTCDQPTGR